jgi:hypothetical protein
MRKKLFLRYFLFVEDKIPYNSDIVATSSYLKGDMLDAIKDFSTLINDWMETHPQGKVDFVWL